MEVEIDAENGSISVWNDGKGIPIQMHREHDMYVPELIFGNLLTGSNFDDDQKKTTGGRNGYGAKVRVSLTMPACVLCDDCLIPQLWRQ